MAEDTTHFGLRYKDVESELNQMFSLCWAAFIVPGSVVQADREENHQQSYPSVNPAYYNSNLLGKIHTFVQ